jgi:hypothetical protein
MMSGLTIGLLSLDYVSLQVLKNSGEPQERVYAARIIPLVRHKHLLLVTLLLCNAAAMEALPIFLDKMVPSYLAIALSVTAVLFFGECVAQAALLWGRVWLRLFFIGGGCGSGCSSWGEGVAQAAFHWGRVWQKAIHHWGEDVAQAILEKSVRLSSLESVQVFF